MEDSNNRSQVAVLRSEMDDMKQWRRDVDSVIRDVRSLLVKQATKDEMEEQAALARRDAEQIAAQKEANAAQRDFNAIAKQILDVAYKILLAVGGGAIAGEKFGWWK